MLIRKVKMSNFMSHSESEVEIPSKGTVVVTGPNGAGKSSIAESIATGVWGKTLRGSSPWVSGSKGEVEITAEVDGGNFTFTRSANKSGKSTASFDPAPTSYSTVSKTQVAIDSITGTFDTWRKCSVFSSQDAAHFTLATDAERKRLLESLLGLDKFDLALKECRDAQKLLLAKIRVHENEILTKTTQITMCERNVKDSHGQLVQARAKAEVEGYSNEERERLEELLKAQREAHVDAYNACLEGGSKCSTLRSEQGTLERELRLFEKELCPTCEQPLHSNSADKVKKRKHKELEQVSMELIAAKKTLKSLKEEDAHLSSVMRKTELLLDKQLSFRSTGQGSIIEHLEQSIHKTQEEISLLSEERKALRKDLVELEYDHALGENIQTVLGTKGVRAHILTSALGALEVTSNKWLQRIAPKTAKLTIRPYMQNKTGGTRDAISLEISGLGKGDGYKSLSGGQRRRVDVALLLGLAELAQASSQVSKGTVFFDEVFDSLDAAGVEAVSGVIEEMSQDRSIVIISHSSDVVDSVHATKHLHIEGGMITEM